MALDACVRALVAQAEIVEVGAQPCRVPRDGGRDAVEAVVLVVPPTGPVPEVGGCAEVVTGGATRSESVRAGLAAIPADVDVVVVDTAEADFALLQSYAGRLDADVVAIQEVDGELAAARVKVMPVEQLAARQSARYLIDTIIARKDG